MDATEDQDNKLIIDEKPHPFSAFLVIIIALSVILPLLVMDGLDTLHRIIGILVSLLFIAIHSYRTAKYRYIVTPLVVASMRMDGASVDESSISSIAISDINYVFTRHHGLRYFLYKLNILNYGDVCFCSHINKSPAVIFHNVENPATIQTSIEKMLT